MGSKGPTVQTTFNAKDKISSPMKKMRSNMKAFAGVAVAAIGAIATGKMAQAVNQFANAGDEIAKTSRKIGISVEALQELRFAADRSGVSSENLDKALEKLNKNVGDLKAGTGALYTYLNKANPALAEQLKNAESNEEAFSTLTEAMANSKDEFERAALAQAAFGRAGQDLIIMTENGSKGIDQLREEARKYGDVISGDAAAASELYVDSLTNMKSAMMSVRNKALTPLISKIQPLIQSVADYIAVNQDFIDQGIQNTFASIGKAVKLITRLWDSGLIPALLAGVGTYVAITKAIVAYKTVLAFAQGVQIAFNAAMMANPVGLIIIGVAALIAIIVLLVKNWDRVKAAVIGFAQSAWEWFSKLLNNPLIAAAGAIFAPWITIPALIIKHWQPLKEFIGSLFEKITAVVDKAKAIGGKVGNFFSGKESSSEGSQLYGRNDGVLQRSETRNSTVDVNLNNLPNGSTVRQRGQAPGVSLNYGYGMGGL